MLQADIVALQHRQDFLEHELIEALRHTDHDQLMIAELKSRVIFLREEIDRLKTQTHVFYN